MAIPNLLELLVQDRSLALRYSEVLHPNLPSAQRFAVWVNGTRIDAVRISITNTTPAGSGGPRRIQSLATGQKAPDLRRALATNITGVAQPAVAITSDKTSLKAGETATITFTFSRDPGRSFRWNGSRGDVRVVGGTLSALRASADAKIFTATFTPSRDREGIATISVPPGSYLDALGNTGVGGLAPEIRADTRPPTLAADSAVRDGALLPHSSRSLSLTFSEPIQLVAAAEAVFQVVDGSGSAIPFSSNPTGADGRQITLVLAAPPVEGAYRLIMASPQIQDAFGNAMGPEPLAIPFRVTPYDAVLVSTAADETLTTGAGNDLIQGRGGRDTISGGAGDDRLLGGNGYEEIDGGPGDDVLHVGTGGGSGMGGPGDDVLRAVLKGASDQVYVSLDGGSGNDRLSVSGSHTGTVWLKGGGGLDRLMGSDGADLLRDNDDAFGDGTGPVIQDGDTLIGGAGDDQIVSRGDKDRINGGAGLDMLFLDVSDITANLTLSLANPSVLQRLPAGGSVVNVERLSLQSGSGDDRLVGGNLEAYFHGGPGQDRITLGSGGGSAFGEQGHDVLVAVLPDSTRTEQLILDGGSGDDRLSVSGKQAGPVRLLGGGGMDALTGSDGNDVLEDSDLDLSTVRFNQDNGHWYQLLPEATGRMGWEAALSTAASSQLWGRQGYLVTITSAAEQAFLTEAFGWKSIWLGASDAAEEGTWRWMNGPEAGSVFYVHGEDTQPGYANWGTGEPNGLFSENYAHWSDGNQWNDVDLYDPFPPFLTTRYVLLEYGGLATDDDGAPVDRADTLSGGEGNDTITSGGDTDRIDGGGGLDHLSLNLAAVTADVALSLANPSRMQPLPGGGFVVNVESLELRSGSGDDSIVGGSGRNTLNGGDGDDAFELGSGGGWASGDAGNDQLLGGTAFAELYGGAGEDLLELGAGGGWADGGAGNDRLRLGSGGGRAFGNAGADELVAVLEEGSVATSVEFYGGIGDDRLSVSGLTAGYGYVNLYGGGGMDFISGSAGNDHLYDDDSTYEEAVFNPLNGHWYRLIYSEMSWIDAQATAAASRLSNRQGYLVTVTSAEEEAFLAHTFSSTFWIGASDAEEEGTWRWLGGPEAGEVFYVHGQESQPGYAHWASGEPNNSGDEDVAHSFVKDNLWLLDAGNENLRWNDVPALNTTKLVLIEYGGTPGDSTEPIVQPGDTLLGGAGDDFITSAGDSDLIDGGAGNDQLSLHLSAVTANLRLSLANPARLQSLPGGGSVVNVETLALWSGSGNDRIVGGKGADNLNGGSGDDLIDGGLGWDMLAGNSGVDVFRFSTTPDSWTNLDTVVDFSAEAGEKIHLARSAFPGLGPVGSLANRRFHNGVAATTAAQRIVYNPLTGALLYDPDGTAPLAPLPFATLSGNLPLTASQFVVV